MNIIEIKKKINQKIDYIKENFQVKEIGIFGSFARGGYFVHEDSDIDILVSFNKGFKDFFNYMRLKYYLEDLLGKKVDLVIKDAVKPRLKEKILNEVQYV
jgi:uncharacterized protein